MKKNSLIIHFLEIFVLSFIIFIFLFGRAFVGIEIIGYRIGELIVALSLVLTFFGILSVKFSKLFSESIKRIIRIHFLFVLSFFIILYKTDSSQIDNYTFKSSSYIWTIGFIYFGYLFFKFYPIKNYFINFLIFITLLVYFNEITWRLKLPQFFIEFLKIHSDKPLQNHKGYDLILVFVISTYLFLRKNRNKRLSIEIFILLAGLYLPLVIYLSKGATLGFIFYIIAQISYNLDSFKKNVLRNILLIFSSVLILYFSFFMLTLFDDLYDPNEDKIEFVLENKFSNSKWLLLYFVDGRLYSDDANANWRIQIWQDVIFDSFKNDNVIFGVGYKNKIPAMDDISRSGRDGTNENVHNFLVNNFARGGIIHFILTIYIFLRLLTLGSKFDFKIATFILPILITSFFGASMESAHFPSVFYFFLGCILANDFD